MLVSAVEFYILSKTYNPEDLMLGKYLVWVYEYVDFIPRTRMLMVMKKKNHVEGEKT